MNKFIISTLVMLAAVSVAPAAGRKPNIVVILADDIGYGDIGCYGATKIKTPNLDRLAQEGRRFTDAHSASAVCTPSRYALLTGQYPFPHQQLGAAPLHSQTAHRSASPDRGTIDEECRVLHRLFRQMASRFRQPGPGLER